MFLNCQDMVRKKYRFSSCTKGNLGTYDSKSRTDRYVKNLL